MRSNVQASTGGLYTCTVSNAAGADSSSTFLYVFPYFTIQPLSALTSSGRFSLLLCQAEAFPNPEYQWQRVDGGPIREGVETNNPNVLSFNPVMFGDEGTYYCNATSLEQTARSLDATITGIC